MESRLITIANFEIVNQAGRIKDWLEAAGIESFILDHGISLEAASQLEGQFELQVFENDVEKALDIIDQIEITEPAEPVEKVKQIREIKKILVPVDFSPCSQNAALWAALFAFQKKAALTLFHVYFNPVTDPVSSDHFYAFPSNIAETMNEVVENSRRLMKEFRNNLQNSLFEHHIDDLAVQTEITGGIAEETVLSFAIEGNYDMLIIGTGGTGENWLGSFTSAIINNSTLPVLAVPGKATFNESLFKRMMYATNFDKSDGKAVRELINIAKPMETHIRVVHIDDRNDNPFINYDLNHFRERYVDEAQEVNMNFDLIVSKQPLNGIEAYIKENQIAILSVTSHKRNMLTALLEPSLTKELLFRLEIPILIFHS